MEIYYEKNVIFDCKEIAYINNKLHVGTLLKVIENFKERRYNVIPLISKSFIDDIVPSIKTREIVSLLIKFCKAAGIEVVAEGVETKEQVETLQKIKCDTIQGNYFSKPLPKNEYEKLNLPRKFDKVLFIM